MEQQEQPEKPEQTSTTVELDKPIQIEFTDDLVKKKCHHKRSTSSNLPDFMAKRSTSSNLPEFSAIPTANPLDLSHQQNEAEKSVVIKESSTHKSKMRVARSPIERTSDVSRNSNLSALSGIKTSQKYAKNLSKKYLTQNVTIEEKDVKPRLQNNFLN